MVKLKAKNHKSTSGSFLVKFAKQMQVIFASIYSDNFSSKVSKFKPWYGTLKCSLVLACFTHCPSRNHYALHIICIPEVRYVADWFTENYRLYSSMVWLSVRGTSEVCDVLGVFIRRLKALNKAIVYLGTLVYLKLALCEPIIWLPQVSHVWAHRSFTSDLDIILLKTCCFILANKIS